MIELEHEDLKPKKKGLFELSENPEEDKERIMVLIDQIFKENNILCPLAIEEQ